MLAGICSIYVKCSEKDKKFINMEIGDGSKFGLSILYIQDICELNPSNTMIVFDNPFIYGPILQSTFKEQWGSKIK